MRVLKNKIKYLITNKKKKRKINNKQMNRKYTYQRCCTYICT